MIYLELKNKIEAESLFFALENETKCFNDPQVCPDHKIMVKELIKKVCKIK
tara:strand:+ start:870 stop:1022 length:153 start_codon:yes stop_codon:yes gene_type:complete